MTSILSATTLESHLLAHSVWHFSVLYIVYLPFTYITRERPLSFLVSFAFVSLFLPRRHRDFHVAFIGISLSLLLDIHEIFTRLPVDGILRYKRMIMSFSRFLSNVHVLISLLFLDNNVVDAARQDLLGWLGTYTQGYLPF